MNCSCIGTVTPPHTHTHSCSDYGVVTKVVIQADLPDGDYLVSWRWDAEQTTQIWQNCADVTIF